MQILLSDGASTQCQEPVQKEICISKTPETGVNMGSNETPHQFRVWWVSYRGPECYIDMRILHTMVSEIPPSDWILEPPFL